LVVQKQVQGAEDPNAKLRVKLREIQGFLGLFINFGMPENELKRDLHNRIAKFVFTVNDLDSQIPEFTTLIEDVETAFQHIDWPTIKDDDMTFLLKTIPQIDPIVHILLKGNDTTKDLVAHMKNIIQVYKDEGVKRKLDVTPKKPKKFVKYTKFGFVFAILVIGLCLSGFIIGRILYVQGSSSGVRVHKTPRKRARKGAKKESKKVSKKGTKKGKGTGKTKTSGSKAPLNP
jgi:hypothetical protein